MRAAWRLGVVGAVLAGVLGGAGTARAGFISVFLSAGVDGASTPSASGGFQFTNPAGTPTIGISDLVGVGSAQANTAGGSAFFGGLGLPIVLNVSDGAAVVSTPNAPAGVGPATGLSSVAPTAPDTVPTDAAILSASLSDPSNGTQLLSVSVTNGVGSQLASGTVVVPEAGWWVIGLSPQAITPPVVEPPVITPPVVEPPVVVPPVENPPVVPSEPPVAATPEPTTLALAALGLPLAGAVRLIRGRQRARA